MPKRVSASNQISKNKSRTKSSLARKQSGQVVGKVAGLMPQWWQKKNLGKEPVAYCPGCHSFYYEEHWHSWQNAKSLVAALEKSGSLRESLCPECQYEKAGHGVTGYEGEVLLKNLANGDLKTEILNTVRNVGKRAMLRDPEDRIIRIEDKGAVVRVTTSENQLAVSIGKQVARSHKGGNLEIIFSKSDNLARVVWTKK